MGLTAYPLGPGKPFRILERKWNIKGNKVKFPLTRKAGLDIVWQSYCHNQDIDKESGSQKLGKFSFVNPVA